MLLTSVLGGCLCISYLLSCHWWTCAQQSQFHQPDLPCVSLLCGSTLLLSSLCRHHSVPFPDIFLLIKLLKESLIRRQSQGGFGLEILRTLHSRLNFDGDEHLTALQVVSELKPCSNSEGQTQEEKKPDPLNPFLPK